MNDVANKTGYLPPGTTLNQVADPWMDNERLPLVTVKRDYDTGTINITQVNRKTFLHQALFLSRTLISHDLIFTLISRVTRDF